VSTLVTVGGFLGAGKTTLIATMARRLSAEGKRVVVVTNDQAPELVDTALVRLTGVPVAEVAGACFCCAFDSFVARADELVALHRPDVIIAEPVGSCVDIAATVLRPLARERGDHLRVAPFTVCVDPAAWQAVEDGRMPADTAYIHRLQTQEADLLLMTKADTAAPASLDLLAERLAARNPAADVMRCSAADGSGLETWLAMVLGGADGGQQRIDVDYDRYAAGEAALGWLNATVVLQGGDWPSVLTALMRAIAARLPPAHLKCLLESGGLTLVANCVTGRPEPTVRTLRDGTPDGEARLTINARVAMDSQELRQLVTASLAALPVRSQVRSIKAFPPGRPVPVHRIG